MGIEPTLSAWKAEVLPLNYTREAIILEGEGFEPSKAEPSDLQSDPFDRSGTPPQKSSRILSSNKRLLSTAGREFLQFSLKITHLGGFQGIVPY
jgi:hypothetical protein